jgi:hypothetical protein
MNATQSLATQPLATEAAFEQQLFTVGQALLQRLAGFIADPSLTLRDLVKCGRVYAYLANFLADREKRRTALEVARIRASATRNAVRGPSRRRDGDDDDIEAPYGRRDDGTPYTHAEFTDALNQSIREIYGITTPICDTANVPPPPPPLPPRDSSANSVAADDDSRAAPDEIAPGCTKLQLAGNHAGTTAGEL